MSKLQSRVFHANDEEEHELEIQFTDNNLYISINWLVGKGGLGGVRAESFELTAEEARSLARDILERIPDPMILEDNILAIQG
jgi:hypothetical protein